MVGRQPLRTALGQRPPPRHRPDDDDQCRGRDDTTHPRVDDEQPGEHGGRHNGCDDERGPESGRCRPSAASSVIEANTPKWLLQEIGSKLGPDCTSARGLRVIAVVTAWALNPWIGPWRLCMGRLSGSVRFVVVAGLGASSRARGLN